MSPSGTLARRQSVTGATAAKHLGSYGGNPLTLPQAQSPRVFTYRARDLRSSPLEPSHQLRMPASMPTSTTRIVEHQASSQGRRNVGTCRTAGLPTVGTGVGSWMPPSRAGDHARAGRSLSTLRTHCDTVGEVAQCPQQSSPACGWWALSAGDVKLQGWYPARSIP